MIFVDWALLFCGVICSCVAGGRFLVVGVWLVGFVLVCLLVSLSLRLGLGRLILVAPVGDLFEWFFGVFVCLQFPGGFDFVWILHGASG